MRSTPHQAENCSARSSAGLAYQPVEPKRSQSGPRTSMPDQAACAESTSPALLPTPRRIQTPLARGSRSGHTNIDLINPTCSRDYKTKLRFSNKLGSEGDQWEQSQAEMAWVRGQLTSRVFQRAMVPGSDCVPWALTGSTSFLNLFLHTWKKEQNCSSLNSDLPQTLRIGQHPRRVRLGIPCPG